MVCHVCKMRDEIDERKEQREAERKAVGIAWINGGMLNDTEETTVITIDAKISPDQKSRLMDVLREFEEAQ